MRRLTAIAVLSICACQGVITEPGEDFGTPGSGTPPPAASTPTTGANAIAASPRVVRLTHEQWENTIRDLFQLPTRTGLSSMFTPDAKTGGFIFDNDATSLAVDQSLWTAYQLAAGDLVELVMTSSSTLAKILPADGGDDAARARAFIEQFGSRAFRRPLEPAEVDAYVTLFGTGSSVYAGVSGFDAGVRLVINAMLQSPHFIYRIERSTKSADARIPLDGWELASRLSYTIWNTMPDETLFTAAASGKLTTASGAEAEARRLLDDPQAEEVIAKFHQVLFDVEKYESINPLAAVFPNAPAGLPALAEQESDLFVRGVFNGGGGYRDLLTSSTSYVNAELAKLYGLSGSFGASFQQVSLDSSRRSGIFTQIGFLAANATAVDPDPIHRGAYLARRIACLTVAAPPADIPPLPEAGDMTNRETVEAHTEQPGSECAGCHTPYINPFGFAFENYDAVGAWRDTDNGKPVDATSSPLLDETHVPVSGAVDLANQLAASKSVHDCYVKHWVEFAFGRPQVQEDYSMISGVGALSKDGAGIKDVLAKLVTSPAFLNRSTKELP
jgi:hypothetical protein